MDAIHDLLPRMDFKAARGDGAWTPSWSEMSSLMIVLLIALHGSLTSVELARSGTRNCSRQQQTKYSVSAMCVCCNWYMHEAKLPGEHWKLIRNCREDFPPFLILNVYFPTFHKNAHNHKILLPMQGRQSSRELEKLQVFGLHSVQHQYGIENDRGGGGEGKRNWEGRRCFLLNHFSLSHSVCAFSKGINWICFELRDVYTSQPRELGKCQAVQGCI
jgi:hypothetical protein